MAQNGALAQPDVESARAEARMQKTLQIADQIHLDKKQEKLFWPLYRNYQSDLKTLNDKRLALINDITEKRETLTNPQATELIRRALALEETRLAMKRRHVALFLEKLPPTVVARYFQLENKMQTEIDAQIAERVPLVGN